VWHVVSISEVFLWPVLGNAGVWGPILGVHYYTVGRPYPPGKGRDYVQGEMSGLTVYLEAPFKLLFSPMTSRSFCRLRIMVCLASNHTAGQPSLRCRLDECQRSYSSTIPERHYFHISLSQIMEDTIEPSFPISEINLKACALVISANYTAGPRVEPRPAHVQPSRPTCTVLSHRNGAPIQVR